MINFRKTKKDLSPAILKEGKNLHEKGAVTSVKIVSLGGSSVRLNCCVQGNFDNHYESKIELCRSESSIVDSDCDCPYNFDCMHIAAVLFYLEDHFDQIVVEYSKETDIEKFTEIDDKEKEQLRETFQQAKDKEVVRRGKKYEKQLIEEYILSSHILGNSPFFQPEEILEQEKAELLVVLSKERKHDLYHEARLSLRLPFRSKPMNILEPKNFIDSVRYHEPFSIGNRRYFFGLRSFDQNSSQILRMIMDFGQFFDDKKNEAALSSVWVHSEALGAILAQACEMAKVHTPQFSREAGEQDLRAMPCIYCGSIEEPLRCSSFSAQLRFHLEHLETPAPKLLLKPSIVIGQDSTVSLAETTLFESARPGLLYENVYYRFQPKIRRKHLRHLPIIEDMTIPEPLFGTFVENSLPELLRFAEVSNLNVTENFVTIPFVDKVSAMCDIHYLDGELEVSLHFDYGNTQIPAAPSQLCVKHVEPFVTPKGILARNLIEEQSIIQDLFQDFHFDERQGCYIAKTEKKIVEFMTEAVPRNQHRVQFKCPENLLEKFIYDDTTFELALKEGSSVDSYEVTLKVHGQLQGLTVDHLWDCLASKRSFIEITRAKKDKKKQNGESKSTNKILVLDLERIASVVQIFDEIGVQLLDNHTEERPLWSLASISKDQFKDLPITFSMSNNLLDIQQQMLGNIPVETDPIPEEILTKLREYQKDGVQWLNRLRNMHLNGILADDMGLGKTVQAITAITQNKKKDPKAISIVVCPTSLIYNWYEEFSKFNPQLKVLAVEGTPAQRKKMIGKLHSHDVVITSYSLLQKDIETYQNHLFSYAILDEAQHIKNRGTRNAKSVKMLKAGHRVILTGTPIENSLDELWSLFDFLMPGLLSSYDRFVEKFVRKTTYNGKDSSEILRRKVSPFILRRMKKDVMAELPPVDEIVYHCHMTDLQRDLYRSYALSAREELSQLVKKEGFEKIQIQVLATLTRLKQICCHPAIFAKEKAELGDSAKYDMLMELLQSLSEGGHKTVIFSQYTRMLNIMRQDLQKQGVKFCYLDGSSKNRMSIVKEFNEDESILVFLVSLKAGGTGLNLVGADTVIHYDMWWNPAVENQATDRVHRIGQKKSVSSYKLVTLGTIEEKIIELQNRKRGLVKKIISNDDEAISKLTWEEVLELLQT